MLYEIPALHALLCNDAIQKVKRFIITGGDAQGKGRLGGNAVLTTALGMQQSTVVSSTC